MDSQSLIEKTIENCLADEQVIDDLNKQEIEKKFKRKYDIIVFGASGFTGQFVVKEMIYFSRVYNLTWAVAGRNTKKLQTVLDNLCNVQSELYFKDHISKLIIGMSNLLSYKSFHSLRNIKNHCVYCSSSLLLKQQWCFSFL